MVQRNIHLRILLFNLCTLRDVRIGLETVPTGILYICVLFLFVSVDRQRAYTNMTFLGTFSIYAMDIYFILMLECSLRLSSEGGVIGACLRCNWATGNQTQCGIVSLLQYSASQLMTHTLY